MLKVGKITGVNGLKGAVALQQIFDNTNWLKEGEALFIELKRESYIPYFVKEVKPAGTGHYLLQLEDIDTADDAKPLVNKTVYVKDEVLAEAEVDSPLLYIGYNLVDKTKGGIGAIEDVMLIGKQWIATLTINGNEVLVPLAEELIIEVNRRNKYIRMQLPDGLIEVYTDDKTENEETE